MSALSYVTIWFSFNIRSVSGEGHFFDRCVKMSNEWLRLMLLPQISVWLCRSPHLASDVWWASQPSKQQLFTSTRHRIFSETIIYMKQAQGQGKLLSVVLLWCSWDRTHGGSSESISNVETESSFWKLCPHVEPNGSGRITTLLLWLLFCCLGYHSAMVSTMLPWLLLLVTALLFWFPL